ncbi:unnamed protein product [Ixodes pacificus]
MDVNKEKIPNTSRQNQTSADHFSYTMLVLLKAVYNSECTTAKHEMTQTIIDACTQTHSRVKMYIHMATLCRINMGMSRSEQSYSLYSNMNLREPGTWRCWRLRTHSWRYLCTRGKQSPSGNAQIDLSIRELL